MVINNPYIPGDPYSYDLKWLVANVKEILAQLGTLDETIEQKIFSGFLEHSIITFRNVEEMLAATVKNNSIVLTNGYYSPGDIGGSFYLVKDFDPSMCTLDYFLTMDNNTQIAVPIFTSAFIYPEQFGAVGDNVSDDTNALQLAMDRAGYSVVLSKNYVVSIQEGSDDGVNSQALNLRDNNEIIFTNNARVRLAPNNYQNGRIFRGNGVSNISIHGNGTIQGDKYTHIGTAGEGGHGILIDACDDVTIYGLKIIENWGDGIAVASYNAAPCHNVHIYDCEILNNSRNNISVVSAINCFIHDCTVNGADRTPPMAGIDIEPNDNSIDEVRKCVISNIIALNNSNASVEAALYNSVKKSEVVFNNILIDKVARFIIRRGSHSINAKNMHFNAATEYDNVYNRYMAYVECNSSSNVSIQGDMCTSYVDVEDVNKRKGIVMATGTDLFNLDVDVHLYGDRIPGRLLLETPTLTQYGNNAFTVRNSAPQGSGTNIALASGLIDYLDIKFTKILEITVNNFYSCFYGGHYKITDNSGARLYNAIYSYIYKGAKFIIENTRATSFGCFGVDVPANSYSEFICLGNGVFGLQNQFTL